MKGPSCELVCTCQCPSCRVNRIGPTCESGFTRTTGSSSRSSKKTKSRSVHKSKDSSLTEDYGVAYGCPLFMMSWKDIRNLIVFVYFLNFLAIIFAIILIYASIRTKLLIGDFINMVTEGDGILFPACLGAAGGLYLPINLLILLCVSAAAHKATNSTANSRMFNLIMFSIFLSCGLLFLAFFSLGHAVRIQHKVNYGISYFMKSYKKDLQAKIAMDSLQINFQCCGNQNYQEWFEIPWYDTSMASSEQDQDTRDDAPFSCCKLRSPYACIHHDLMSVGSSYLYAPESNLSVSERGCHPVLLKYTKIVAWRIALTILIFVLLQLLICILTRLIQTGHREFYRFERNSHWHTTWLFGGSRQIRTRMGPRPPPIPYDLRS